MNKDVRNAFVELSLGELGRDIPNLLDYCAADVRATLQATLCSRRFNSSTTFLVEVSSQTRVFCLVFLPHFSFLQNAIHKYTRVFLFRRFSCIHF
jgi:hypothetical protein